MDTVKPRFWKFRPTGSFVRVNARCKPAICTPLKHIHHWRIIQSMIFIETSVFTRQVLELLTDEE